MKCALCGKTSIDTKIRQFPLSPEARAMLRRQFGINPDEAFVQTAVCRECLALPYAERNRLRRPLKANRTNTGASCLEIPSIKAGIKIRTLALCTYVAARFRSRAHSSPHSPLRIRFAVQSSRMSETRDSDR